MDILIESPWPWIIFGVIGEAILAVVLLRTGRGVLLWLMAAVLAVALLGLAVEHLVVTDRKLVAGVLYDTAAALEADNLDRVLAHISPDDEESRKQAAWALQQARIVELKIRCLEITINRLTSPTSAKATFNVIVTGRDRRGEYGQQTRFGKLIVELRRDPGGWVITHHTLIPDPR